MNVLTDEQIILKHDKGCRDRARKELALVNQLIASATARDYTLRVVEYEIEDQTSYNFKTAVFDLDDAHVLVFDAAGKIVGWVYLVFGNDGYDLISDYTVNLDSFLADCNALAEKLEEGAMPV